MSRRRAWARVSLGIALVLSAAASTVVSGCDKTCTSVSRVAFAVRISGPIPADLSVTLIHWDDMWSESYWALQHGDWDTPGCYLYEDVAYCEWGSHRGDGSLLAHGTGVRPLRVDLYNDNEDDWCLRVTAVADVTLEATSW
ncbi:MAG: hypothetical protein HY908_32625 [Myxococcales bacterium]|nr:hypothetical protein [Myxococcales bacterium]